MEFRSIGPTRQLFKAVSVDELFRVMAHDDMWHLTENCIYNTYRQNWLFPISGLPSTNCKQQSIRGSEILVDHAQGFWKVEMK